MKRISLLLTSAIDSSGISHCAIDNTSERYEEYRTALSRWLTKSSVERIIFCDNTSYPLDGLRCEVKSSISISKRVEFLQYNGQEFPRSLGKGYGEMLTMKYVEEHSEIYRDSDLVLKVNGRYFIENVDRLISGIATLGAPSIIGNFASNLSYMDSRVFAFQPAFFNQYFSPLHNLLNDAQGRYFEHVLARATHAALADGKHWEMLPELPIICGRSGTTGHTYSTSLVKNSIKQLQHRLKKRMYEN